ncbi:UDP-4-amino-4,6-dideoxy-N-acetyl-beta-L-altrosamine transaminase [Spiribacter roseus]|uniref:UDP-4-amino-4, 6-dideoxy-N-acetyl-beta-L-altrosamine transaminase n=1 Tax=Spiribacter roseus TaxID=1855875 RepID=UPI00133077EB|nr:UDP-4-amino-4,6-dideoxy-N-acetyl-beta-L-altrosamine transaminase [Spiribacter roseus]KAF0281450.1 UDP-4-amino-4,6-dideoxy-N-acetyl-beta-L-altrosamine transaminase [Spiribacter roseus]
MSDSRHTRFIPYGRQDISEADIEAVVEVLRSDLVTQGPVVPRFEQAVADYCGAGHGVATSSATAALHVACAALDLGPGDWLWTSPNTFVASANAARYCGARVDFVDIDPRTYNMSADALAEKLTVAEKEGKLPKIVMPVHFAGQSCDMAAIHAFSERYGFRIIEDASHAIGGRYQDEPVGNCRYSDVAVFSFHPVKIITTGEGGMAVTNNAELAGRMGRLRSHGITRDPALMADDPDGPWDYEQIELGFHYRMTDIQAALGLSQMQRLDEFITKRRAIAAHYDEHLAPLPVTTPYQHPKQQSAYHLYPIQVRDAATRREVFQSLRDAGIGVNVHYIPVHTQPDYQQFGFGWDDYPQGEAFYRRAISLPMFPRLSGGEQQRVIAEIGRVLA